MKWTDLTLSLKDDHTPPLVSCSQQLSCLVEFHCGDDISWKGRKGKQLIKTILLEVWGDKGNHT